MGGERAAEAPVPTGTSSELGREDLRSGAPQNPDDPRGVPAERAPAVVDRREIFRAMEVVERDSPAIAESFGPLFSSLRLALSEVTSTSVENMQCFSDVVGQLQESEVEGQSELGDEAPLPEAVQEKLQAFTAKAATNIAAMPAILNRMKECITMLDKVEEYDNVNLHPVFKRKRGH